jgi:murein DD-endopeptidase MepM/ murein hydrolase activator NlpD
MTMLPFLLGGFALLLLKPSDSSAVLRKGASPLRVVPVAATVSSGYGWRKHPIFKDADGNKAVRHHNGYDLSCPQGTPIYAAGDGVVEFAGWNSGYGNLTRIEHGGGLSTRYGHQSKLLVKAGQVVKAGQKIGLVGSTGKSTGPHLHFEVRVDKKPVDPALYLPALKLLPGKKKR